MNPNAILAIWANFNVVFDSAFFTNQEKAAIGKELLGTLPHEGLYASFDETVAACRRSIKDRIATLEVPSEQDSVLGGSAAPQDQDAVPARKTRGSRK